MNRIVHSWYIKTFLNITQEKEIYNIQFYKIYIQQCACFKKVLATVCIDVVVFCGTQRCVCGCFRRLWTTSCIPLTTSLDASYVGLCTKARTTVRGISQPFTSIHRASSVLCVIGSSTMWKLSDSMKLGTTVRHRGSMEEPFIMCVIGGKKQIAQTRAQS